MTRLQEKRKALVDRFYTSLDASALNEILADSFTMRERGSSKSFSKQGELVRCHSSLHTVFCLPNLPSAAVTNTSQLCYGLIQPAAQNILVLWPSESSLQFLTTPGVMPQAEQKARMASVWSKCR